MEKKKLTITKLKPIQKKLSLILGKGLSKPQCLVSYFAHKENKNSNLGGVCFFYLILNGTLILNSIKY